MQITFDDIKADVVRKKIKTIRLTVHPPDGEVRISAPDRTGLDEIRLFAMSKAGWIKKHQLRMRELAQLPRREYAGGETHYVWGTPYSLRVFELNHAPGVRLENNLMILNVRPGASRLQRREVVDAWHGSMVVAALPELIGKWEPAMGIRVRRCVVRKMETRWGSCSSKTGRIRINAELASKPPECLEYILVHEMAHMIEPGHGPRFFALLDKFVPDWKSRKKKLAGAVV